MSNTSHTCSIKVAIEVTTVTTVSTVDVPTAGQGILRYNWFLAWVDLGWAEKEWGGSDPYLPPLQLLVIWALTREPTFIQ